MIRCCRVILAARDQSPARPSPRNSDAASGRSRCARGLVHAPLVLLAATACARPEAPPGGPEDLTPPVVVETIPDTFAAVEPGAREFFFRFNERISERPSAGQLNNSVVISPSLGAIRVRHSRDALSIEAEEGLAPDRLYRVTVLPVINDMFGNRLRDPFDLVLSTGEEFVPNVVAGMVEDRITGQAAPDVRVQARFRGEADTLVHWNFTGADGVFSLRYVPEAPYELLAWQDRNRDGEVGESEPQSAATSAELAASPDTSFTILSLIEPDTTPPRLASVNVDDSVTLTFEFDDYLEPQMPGVVFEGRLILARLLDTTTVADTPGADEPSGAADAPQPGDTIPAEADPDPDAPGDTVQPEAETNPDAPGDTARGGEAAEPGEPGDTVLAEAAGDSTVIDPADTITVPPEKDTISVRFFHQHEYDRWRREVEDSIARAEAQALADSLLAAGEQQPPPEEEEEEADSAAAPPSGLSGLLLPSQTLIGVLEESLVRGAPYEASVGNVVNIYQTTGGGGQAVVLWELPPPDTTSADSTAVADSLQAGDSLQVGDSVQAGDSAQVADTVGVGPDTTTAGTDTTIVTPDTTTVTPDTTTAGPDTTTAGPDTTRTGTDTSRAGPDTAWTGSPLARSQLVPGSSRPTPIPRRPREPRLRIRCRPQRSRH